MESSKVKFLKIGIIVSVVAALLLNVSFGKNNITKQQIRDKFFIDITQMQSKQELPVEMFQQYQSIQFQQSTEEEISKTLSILPDALEKYPSNILKNTLGNITLFKTLIVDSIGFAGTYGNQQIFISTLNPEYVEATLHHELSTLLILKYPFKQTDWINSSSSSIPYQLSFEPSSLDYTAITNETLFQEGYLSHYSTQDPENDLNMYAETIFSNPEGMSQLVATYPKIKERYQIVKAFYLSIDTGFKPVFDRIDQ
ncbi:hypothetical protein [Litoribacillus peritrichatus]|uniref:Uncharacterized protein n=1 Tax=Litoribacillus peritrichatus TaxID=718191 RepID=A0ABP7N4F5_9GAMM